MEEPLWIRGYRLFFGILVLYTVYVSFGRTTDTPLSWASAFTHEVNFLAGVLLIAGALLGAGILTSPLWDHLRGATVVYLVITFFVYGFLIREFDNPFTTTRHWTHTVLHQLMPLVVVVEALIHPFFHRIQWRMALVWTIYPAIYFAYSMIRGAFIDWYPYTFVDPAEVGGYDGVAMYAVAILAGFIGVSLLVIALSRLRFNLHLHLPSGFPA
jgi:hypothetical protein